MQSKRFIQVWFLLTAIIIIMIALLNYVIDPFGVFGVHFLEKTKTLNERVVKIDYLNKHKARYDSFMLGSSSIGTTDPKVLEKYNKGSHFYNLTCSSGNMYDFDLLINYVLNTGFHVKNIYLQIDMTNMREFGKHDFYAQKHHYLLSGESMVQFYAQYLTIFPYSAMKKKILLAVTDANTTEFDIENSGRWFRREQDFLRQKDLTGYIDNEPSFKKKARRTRGIEKNIDQIIAAYKDIVLICQKHDVHLTILTTAYNHVRMDAFKIDDVLYFIKTLAMYHDIWYFSGYNSITNDDRNYYEVNHYVARVGALKAARIYHDRDVNVPKDFGTLVTKENLNTMMESIKENLYKGHL